MEYFVVWVVHVYRLHTLSGICLFFILEHLRTPFNYSAVVH